MSIVIVFFESALELIPVSLRKHPLIRKEWRRNVKMKNQGIILDGAIHRPLVESLKDAEKRGRPDIIHHSLLNLMYSPLFLENKVKAFIHTRNDLCIQIPSKWRIPVNYNRFIGLFSQLLLKKRVPLSDKPILTARHCSLEKLLQPFDDSEIFLCDVPTKDKEDLFPMKNLKDISPLSSKVFLIGGFQRGDAELHSLDSSTSTQNWSVLSLYNEVKPAWVITAKIIYWLEVSDH